MDVDGKELKVSIWFDNHARPFAKFSKVKTEPEAEATGSEAEAAGPDSPEAESREN